MYRNTGNDILKQLRHSFFFSKSQYHSLPCQLIMLSGCSNGKWLKGHQRRSSPELSGRGVVFCWASVCRPRPQVFYEFKFQLIFGLFASPRVSRSWHSLTKTLFQITAAVQTEMHIWEWNRWKQNHVVKFHPKEFVSKMLFLKMKVIPLAWVKQIVNASSMLQSLKATDLTLQRTQEKDNIQAKQTSQPEKRLQFA